MEDYFDGGRSFNSKFYQNLPKPENQIFQQD